MGKSGLTLGCNKFRYRSPADRAGSVSVALAGLGTLVRALVSAPCFNLFQFLRNFRIAGGFQPLQVLRCHLQGFNKPNQFMTKNKSSTPAFINTTVNKYIHLAEVEAFKQASKTAVVCCAVRAMMIYSTNEQGNSKDDVGTVEQIARWSRAAKRRNEFRELMVSLVLLAEGKAADHPRRVEQTDLHDEIWEIKAPGQRMRLFAFFDEDQLIIISEHYQKHGRNARDERRLQDRAIERAAARKDLYKKAHKISRDLYQVKDGNHD